MMQKIPQKLAGLLLVVSLLLMGCGTLPGIHKPVKCPAQCMTVNVFMGTSHTVPNDVTQYTVDWGDGTPVTTYQGRETGEHTYTTEGTYAIKVTITYSSGETGENLYTATVPY